MQKTIYLILVVFLISCTSNMPRNSTSLSTIFPWQCKTDSNCGSGTVCNNGTGICSECNFGNLSMCSSGQFCNNNICVSCTTDSNCGSSTPFCFNNQCVECETSSDCASNHDGKTFCSNNSCESPCGLTLSEMQTNYNHCGACNNTCGTDEVCTEGSCVSTCTSKASFGCFGNHVYYKDSCGNWETGISPHATCSCGCTGSSCDSCTPLYVCSSSNCNSIRTECTDTSCFGNEILQTCKVYTSTCKNNVCVEEKTSETTGVSYSPQKYCYGNICSVATSGIAYCKFL